MDIQEQEGGITLQLKKYRQEMEIYISELIKVKVLINYITRFFM